MLRTIFCILIICTALNAAQAQQASASPNQSVLAPVDPKTVKPFLPDSEAKASRQQYLADSISMCYLTPDSTRKSQLWEKAWRTDLYQVLEQPAVSSIKTVAVKSGIPRNSRPAWVVMVLIGLLFYIGLLNVFLRGDIRRVLQSFYDKNALSKTDKETGLINSWAFLGLFILFCLTTGLVIFLVTQYYGIDYGISGFQLFITLAFCTAGLLVLKFLLLKMLGYIFEAGTAVSEYLAILNLTYFNVAFVLLCMAICFSLLASRFIPLLLTTTLVLIGVIFLWQYIRNSLSIISDFRFQKFYLFVYLCALEICPILILLKALNV